MTEETFARWKLSLVSGKKEKIPLDEDTPSRTASPSSDAPMTAATPPAAAQGPGGDTDMVTREDPTTNHLERNIERSGGEGAARPCVFDHPLLARNHLPPQRPGANCSFVSSSGPYLGIERPNPNPRRSRRYEEGISIR